MARWLLEPTDQSTSGWRFINTLKVHGGFEPMLDVQGNLVVDIPPGRLGEFIGYANEHVWRVRRRYEGGFKSHQDLDSALAELQEYRERYGPLDSLNDLPHDDPRTPPPT